MANPIKDVLRLFFPATCVVCENPLAGEDDFLCTRCRWEIPLTGFCHISQNPVYLKLSSYLPLVNASSFFFFIHESGFRGMIHKLKYSGGWHIAQNAGYWFGTELAASTLYKDIDVIVPVPLHYRKLLKRGYNQSEYIATGVSRALNLPLSTGNIIRRVHNKSQTKRSRSERWDNVQGIFSVRDPQELAGKHILLVDDVLTTGATLISCGETILNTIPNSRLSIITLAVSKNEI